MEQIRNYKEFLRQSIEIGRKIPSTEKFILQLKEALDKPYEKPEDMFGNMEFILFEEFGRTIQYLQEQERQSHDVKAQVPSMMKAIYLTPIILETIANSQRYHIERGDRGVATPGEITFYTTTYPSVLQRLKTLQDHGAEFDIPLVTEISGLYNASTLGWLKETWLKSETDSGISKSF